MSSYKHFPIAVSKLTNSIIHIGDIQENGLSCNCYCAGCKGQLIAVTRGQIQRPHFRHQVETNCAFNNFETYLHWLAKCLISTMTSIKLPEIKLIELGILSSNFNTARNKIEDRLKAEGVFDFIKPNEINSLILQKHSEIHFEKVEIENNAYLNDFYIRPDITIYAKERKLFIEPFWSNRIDDKKSKKIQELDISTVSINLRDFTNKYKHDFKIEEFSNFLRNDIKSKEWEYISKSKLFNLIENILGDNFHEKLKVLKEKISKYKAMEKVINDKVDAIRKKNIEIIQLQNEVDELNATQPNISILSLFTK